MGIVPEEWTSRLASAIGAALREYGSWRLRGTPVVAFDVGCFPWHGSIELSVLSADELYADPVLMAPEESAAWRHYNFAAGLSSWAPEVELGRQMADEYRAADEPGRPVVVDAFLRACAAAVARPEVTEALGSLAIDPRFRIRVAHPDRDQGYWPPEGEADAGPGAAPARDPRVAR